MVSNRSAEIRGLKVQGFPSMAECAEQVLAELRSGNGGAAFAINAEKIVTSSEDARLRNLLEQATLRYPDGAGAVLAMRRHGIATVRIPGVELWLAILHHSAPHRLRVALIGARGDVLEQVRRKLGEEFPHVQTVLAIDGFEGARDASAVRSAVAEAKPDLVYVAMGTPRQEELITDLRGRYPHAYYFGLGGSFDVYCGLKKRAPIWMQRLGLEWLFRFLMEPTRAARETKRLRFLWMLIRGAV
jgi:UDP-N-acetyl-D-mannosaminouronate:lipid I N-acetyl-D-mannosaminouronosyltransferase